MGYIEVNGTCEPCPKWTYFYPSDVGYQCRQCTGYYSSEHLTTEGIATTSDSGCGE